MHTYMINNVTEIYEGKIVKMEKDVVFKGCYSIHCTLKGSSKASPPMMPVLINGPSTPLHMRSHTNVCLFFFPKYIQPLSKLPVALSEGSVFA